MKKVIGVLVAVLCCVGIYKITQLPSGLTYDLRGTYMEDLPEGAISFNYFSVAEHDFHFFNEDAEKYLYGTYEKTGDNQYLLKGKHIEEQTVSLDKEYKFVLKLEGREIVMKKQDNASISINDSWEKAKANDRKIEQR